MRLSEITFDHGDGFSEVQIWGTGPLKALLKVLISADEILDEQERDYLLREAAFKVEGIHECLGRMDKESQNPES